ncbi:PAS domain-containing protein [Marivita sp. S6314]|uniref:PAS domain-containing protein n=1 Tax=Marivita sp. S6314 TaxID=2926406 RepID=UPI001FF10E1B|nr:PAS domain-containing protein [Marivita sp. S6314]MCK0148530.1 PAS domain-containing protein [Marivita sp. S6314]
MYSTSLVAQALTHHQANAVQTVDRYWHRLAAQDGIPTRASIDPQAIQDALEYAFIAEHLAAGHAKLRVAGGSLSTTLGMEVTGMPLAVMITPSDRTAFAREIARTLDTPRLLSMMLCAATHPGQGDLTASLRIYPLRDTRGVTKMLGTFVTTGPVGRTPRRFRITSINSTPIFGARPISGIPLITRGHLSLVVSN